MSREDINTVVNINVIVEPTLFGVNEVFQTTLAISDDAELSNDLVLNNLSEVPTALLTAPIYNKIKIFFAQGMGRQRLIIARPLNATQNAAISATVAATDADVAALDITTKGGYLDIVYIKNGTESIAKYTIAAAATTTVDLLITALTASFTAGTPAIPLTIAKDSGGLVKITCTDNTVKLVACQPDATPPTQAFLGAALKLTQSDGVVIIENLVPDADIVATFDRLYNKYNFAYLLIDNTISIAAPIFKNLLDDLTAKRTFLFLETQALNQSDKTYLTGVLALNYRCLGVYYDAAGTGIDFAIAGYISSINWATAGARFLTYLTFASGTISPAILSKADKAVLTAASVNFYSSVANKNLTLNDKLYNSDTQYISSAVASLYITLKLQSALFAFITENKLGNNRDSWGLIQNVIEVQLKNFVDIGIINNQPNYSQEFLEDIARVKKLNSLNDVPNKPYIIYIDESSFDEVKRANRTAPDIYAWFEILGQMVKIDLIVKETWL